MNPKIPINEIGDFGWNCFYNQDVHIGRVFAIGDNGEVALYFRPATTYAWDTLTSIAQREVHPIDPQTFAQFLTEELVKFLKKDGVAKSKDGPPTTIEKLDRGQLFLSDWPYENTLGCRIDLLAWDKQIEIVVYFHPKSHNGWDYVREITHKPVTPIDYETFVIKLIEMTQ